MTVQITVKLVCDLKKIEYITHFCNLKTQAFDRVKLNDVVAILQEKGIAPEIIRLIAEMNSGAKTRIRANNEYTDDIRISAGIRQGDSLSPALFNLVMNRIIESIRQLQGFTM